MRTIPELALAVSIALYASPLHAQINTLRANTDRNATTGTGGPGTSRAMLPPEVPVPRPDVEPDGQPRRVEADDGKESKAPREAPPPPPAAVKEDPRTMITRDRIESPQH